MTRANMEYKIALDIYQTAGEFMVMSAVLSFKLLTDQVVDR